MRECSPDGAGSLVAEGGALDVGLREVSHEEGDPGGVGVDDSDAWAHEGTVDVVAEYPPGTEAVEEVEKTGENEFNLSHLSSWLFAKYYY